MCHKNKYNKITLLLCLFTLLFSQSSFAQDEEAEEVVVTGIRGSLQNALIEKREANNIIEIIQAEDIGKLPDQNLAEVLENITGIQITREAGVGTGVQIRGTDENRIEINGVSTVGSDVGRGGISFEDIDASIISAVEVTKAPSAKTIEGSVGGTINLRTIRPLDLDERVGSIRVQGENSDLSTDKTFQPRLSGTFGDNWSTDIGHFGAVVSGSISRQDVSHFRPRLDRDNLISAADASNYGQTEHFLGVQFLNQVYTNQEYETKNFAGAFEFAPNENLRFYFDAVLNDQERRQESSRAQISNISRVNGGSDDTDGANADFLTFETFNLGSLEGENGNQNLGSILAVTSGTFSPQQAGEGRGAPFLRGSSDSGSRLTESEIFRLGTDFEYDRISGQVEVSTSESETVNPNFSLTLNFINPNSDREGTRDENGVPIKFDLRDGIAFGINFDDPNAPTTVQLLDPNNYVLDNGGTYSANVRENQEDAFRLDFSYDFTDLFQGLDSVDVGYRFNKRTSLRDDREASVGGTSNFDGSINAGNFPGLVTPAPDNFGDGTGSNLFIKDFLHINPELATNPEALRAALNAVITANNAATGQNVGLIGTLVSVESAFFDIEEKTNAVYGQANFEYGILRGNVGVRYVHTELESVSNRQEADGSFTRVMDSSSYDFFLPRVNLVINPIDDVIVRGAYSQDINRPDFEHLTQARTFPNRGGVNDVSRIGNASLNPEEVQSFDFSAEWYFAPASVVSAGFFYKERTELFGDNVAQPGGPGDPGVVAPNSRDIEGPVCEAGGIFSSNTDAGIFGPGRGVCVGDSTRFNAEGETTQKGIELAFQYSLAEWEDQIGWGSGFGLITNYTYQEQEGSDTFTTIGESRARAIYAAQGLTGVNYRVGLLNLSEHAYNVTVFYEKYGISARARYTWRDAFRTDDLPGTSNEFDPFGTRGVQEARGQLNASITYDVNDHLNIGIEGINLTQSDAEISCANEGALLCYQGLTDRRILVGASYSF